MAKLVKRTVLLADSWKAHYGTPKAKYVSVGKVQYKLEGICPCPHVT